MAKNSDDHIRVGTIKTVPVNSLQQHPENVRLHGNRNIDDIKASLREFGQRRPLLVAKDETTVVAGNGTLQAAIALGWDSVSVQLTDLEGDVALAYAIADNRTAETSEWDDEALADQLRRFMEDGKQHLAEATGWNSDELAARFNVFPGGQPSEPEEAPEPQIDRAEELREKWGVESGQIWTIKSRQWVYCPKCKKVHRVSR